MHEQLWPLYVIATGFGLYTLWGILVYLADPDNLRNPND